jgi:hypothetical protein
MAYCSNVGEQCSRKLWATSSPQATTPQFWVVLTLIREPPQVPTEPRGAGNLHPPKRNSRKPWSKRLRRWVAGIRQIVESVYDKLFNAFGLWRERPHLLIGLRARLAARVALHNFCIWLNDQLGRPRLAFSDLLGW